MSVCLSVCLSFCLSVCLPVCLSASLTNTSKKKHQLCKIQQFPNLRARKLFFHTIFNPSSITDRHGGTQQVQNTFKPLASLHKRALKVILLQTTTLAILDCNLLSIRDPLSEDFTVTRDLRCTKLCPEMPHPLLQLNFP